MTFKGIDLPGCICHRCIAAEDAENERRAAERAQDREDATTREWTREDRRDWDRLQAKG